MGDFLRRRRRSKSDAMGAAKQGRRTSQREASSQQRQRQPGSVRDRGLGSRLLGSADQKENVGEAWSPSVERLGLKAV